MIKSISCKYNINYFRFIISGDISTYAYKTKFLAESILAHPDFLSSSIAMNLLAIGSNDVMTESGISISSPVSSTATSQGFSNHTLTYLGGSNTVSDVYFQTDTYSFSVIENTITKFSTNLSWSISGTTSITFSIGDYNGEVAPSWISINSNNGTMTINSPNISSDTDYKFYINANIAGVSNPIQTLIKLKVIAWVVLNCQKCSTNILIWDLWDTGYDLNLSICEASSSLNTSSSNSSSSSENDSIKTAKILRMSNQSIIGATVIVTIKSSIANVSSTSSLWSLINQMQLLFLLFLTRAYLPGEVRTTIIGSQFVLNPTQHIPLERISVYDSALDNFNFELSNALFEPLEVNSDSSFYNTSSTSLLLIDSLIFHIIVYILYKLISRINTEGRWWFKVVKWIIKRIYPILTYGYYIRTILELNQYLLVTSIYEIHEFNTHGVYRILSLIYAFCLIILCLLLIGITFYLGSSSYSLFQSEHNKLGEFFVGVKGEKKFKLYVWVLIMRRTIMVFFLIIFMSISSRLLIGILVCILLLQLIYVSILRPFKEVKDNIVEIINEFYLLILFSNWIYFNTKEEWNTTITSIYVWVIASNSIMIFIISIGNESIFLFL